MTVDRLPEGLREGSESDREHGGLEAATILSMCDRLLGEDGRRAHMFGWLRVPGSSSDKWLAVDAYYPRSRLVVMCQRAPEPHEALYRERIPAHGRGLLTLDPVALGSDPAAVESALGSRLLDRDREQAAPRRHEPRRSGRTFSMAPVSSHARAAGATDWTPVTVERTPVPPAVQHGLGVVVGVVVGVAVATVLMAELYLGVVLVGLQAGRPVLGLAIALEACSRGLGTVAAERAGQRGWACACAVGGAPVVAWFALARRAGRAEAEPAPLAKRAGRAEAEPAPLAKRAGRAEAEPAPRAKRAGRAVAGPAPLAKRAGRAEAEPAPLAGLLGLLAGVVAVLALLIGS